MFYMRESKTAKNSDFVVQYCHLFFMCNVKRGHHNKLSACHYNRLKLFYNFKFSLINKEIFNRQKIKVAILFENSNNRCLFSSKHKSNIQFFSYQINKIN